MAATFYAGVNDANGILHSVRGVDTFEERDLQDFISRELGEGWQWLPEPSHDSNPLDERDERIGDNLPRFVP